MRDPDWQVIGFPVVIVEAFPLFVSLHSLGKE